MRLFALPLRQLSLGRARVGPAMASIVGDLTQAARKSGSGPSVTFSPQLGVREPVSERGAASGLERNGARGRKPGG